MSGRPLSPWADGGSECTINFILIGVFVAPCKSRREGKTGTTDTERFFCLFTNKETQIIDMLTG